MRNDAPMLISVFRGSCKGIHNENILVTLWPNGKVYSSGERNVMGMNQYPCSVLVERDT